MALGRLLAFSTWLVSAVSLHGTTPVETLPAVEPLRLIILGDHNASAKPVPGIAALHRQSPIHAIVMTGDNFYPCGVASLEAPHWAKLHQNYGPFGVPLFPVLGNHDYGDPSTAPGKGREVETCGDADPEVQIAATNVVPNWNFPARNYVLRGPFVDLIMFDTEPVALGFDTSFRGSATHEEAVAWLRGALAQSNAPWKFVVGHHALYSSGHYGNANDSVQRRLRALDALFREHRVGLYLTGHDHHVELLGDSPLHLVSGAGTSTRALTRLRDDTLFPASPDDVFIGFALIEVWSDCLEITIHDQTGARRSRTYTARNPHPRQETHANPPTDVRSIPSRRPSAPRGERRSRGDDPLLPRGR